MPKEPRQQKLLTRLKDCFSNKVSKKKYDELRAKYDNLKEERDACKTDSESANETLKQIEAMIDEESDEINPIK